MLTANRVSNAYTITAGYVFWVFWCVESKIVRATLILSTTAIVANKLKTFGFTIMETDFTIMHNCGDVNNFTLELRVRPTSQLCNNRDT